MRMPRFQRAIPLAVCCVWLLPVIVAAQSSQWAAVVALPSGVTVRVEDSAGSVQAGQFLGANDRRLTIAVAGRPMDISRTSVGRLYRISDRKVRRYAWRGFIIGAVAGATLGAFAAHTNKAQWSALMAIGWGMLGATIGSINGLDRDPVLVFERDGLVSRTVEATR
jgi:hypothetical protein